MDTGENADDLSFFLPGQLHISTTVFKDKRGTAILSLSQSAGRAGVPQVPVGQAAHGNQPQTLRSTNREGAATEICQI